jgi:hypothetical protein
VSGSENLLPNCRRSALSQAEFCHSGTVTSFRTTECSDAETIIIQCRKHEERQLDFFQLIKVKVKLPWAKLVKHSAMKTYGGMEV